MFVQSLIFLMAFFFISQKFHFATNAIFKMAAFPTEGNIFFTIKTNVLY